MRISSVDRALARELAEIMGQDERIEKMLAITLWAHRQLPADGVAPETRTLVRCQAVPVPQPVTYYGPIQDVELSAQVVTTTETVTFKYDDAGRVISQTTETATTSTAPVTA
jgi:YD repeat-containing protein